MEPFILIFSDGENEKVRKQKKNRENRRKKEYNKKYGGCIKLHNLHIFTNICSWLALDQSEC